MLFRCIIGIILGTALGIAGVVYIFRPWGDHVDDFNYMAGPEMVAILILGAVLGGIIGGLSYVGRRQPTGKLPARPAAPPDDRTWPPPPSPPAG